MEEFFLSLKIQHILSPKYFKIAHASDMNKTSGIVLLKSFAFCAEYRRFDAMKQKNWITIHAHIGLVLK